MIKVSGKSGKSIIAEAIQKYNGAVIYSYYDELLPFENGYHVDSGKYSIDEFCEGITVDIKEKVEGNEGVIIKHGNHLYKSFRYLGNWYFIRICRKT